MEPGGAASLPAPAGGKWRRTIRGQLSSGLLVSAAPAARWQWLLTSDNEPSQGAMQKLGVQSTQGREMGQTNPGESWDRLTRRACGSGTPNNRRELCDLGK